MHEDSQGQPELITTRNDPYINSYNRLQLQGWRANVDLKPVFSINAALQYICKYTSKAEPRSLPFSDLLNQILHNSDPNDPSITSIQRLLLHTVTERDISAQETCHLLLGIPLYHSSRRFVTLNLNNDTLRYLNSTRCFGDEQADAFEVSNSGRIVKSSLQLYWDRPAELDTYRSFI